MLLPRYGSGALSDVIPSLLAGIGVPGMTNTLSLPEAPKVCMLLIDGMGWPLLQAHARDAPFLSSLAGGSITAGFPATTATSLASLGTGVPPGEHGVVGYSFAASDDELINALSWGLHATGKRADLRERYVPEEFQPLPTVFERASDAGVLVRLATGEAFEGSGLTRAVLRGGEFDGVLAFGDLASKSLDALNAADRVFCYAYHSQLDLLGHVYGPGTRAWRFQLGHVDRLASAIAENLPPGATLVITADHGMLPVGEQDWVDFDETPSLRDGVRLVGGEPRVRHLYVEPGSAESVLSTWRSELGDRAWIVPRDEAVDGGWFGPRVLDRVRGRIGDVIVAARGTTAIVRSGVEPRMSRLAGQHGSLTPDDQLIPLLYCQG